MMDLLRELREGFQALEERKRGEIVSTLREAAEILGISRRSLFRYRQMYPGFPTLPCFKMSLRGYMERRGLPRKRGPKTPSERGRRVTLFREVEGITFAEIGRRPGISKSAAWQLWRRMQKVSGGVACS